MKNKLRSATRRVYRAIMHYLIHPFRKRRRDNRRLSEKVRGLPKTEAAFIVNEIGRTRSFSKYLEVGIERGFTLEAISIPSRTGVDPHPLFNVRVAKKFMNIETMESDKFFSKISQSTKFDFIYLDGLHTYEQTRRDFENSLKHISPNGLIMIDDTVPNDVYSANPDQKGCYEDRSKNGVLNDGSWHGDVYKVVSMIIEMGDTSINWATLSDLENPKTIFWVNVGQNWPSFFPQNVKPREYDEIFSHSQGVTTGIPGSFRPLSSAELFKLLS